MDSLRDSYQGDKKGLFLHVKMPANISNESAPLLGEKHFLDEAEIIPPDFVYKKQQESRRMYTLLTGFFMNPIEKWRIRRLFPWKLCIQICILVLGAFQMYSFGEQRSHHLRRNAETSMTLSKMFLKDWAPEEAANPYVDRQHAVYTAPDFFAHVDFAMNQFRRLNSITSGPYGYDSRNGKIYLPTICLRAYDGHVYPETSIIEINGPPRETCLNIAFPDANEAFSIVDFLQKLNITLDFGIFISAETNMRLRSVSTMSTDIVPECHLLNVTTTYDNSDHNGLLAIAMRIASTRIDCQIKRKLIDNLDDRLDDSLGKKLIDVSLLVLCVFSFSLCARSIFRGWRLGCEAARYFELYHGQRMSMGERIDFVDLWYVAIVGGAVLAAAGSLLQSRPLQEEGDFATCSVLLGVGYLLVLIGTLRYLKLFPTYNLLLLTLKKATPNVLRFIFAVLLLFAGYCLCGWVVLSPYHAKFSSLSSAAESLFADMNGDEVFETFAALHPHSGQTIWWFARLYLYSFSFLFLYLAASLLVSVIMDTFDVVKRGAPPVTMVERFLATPQEDPDDDSLSDGSLIGADFGLGNIKKFLIWSKLDRH